MYLPWDLRPCKFSAIAKEDNISGVHTAEKLLNKRLPLMARLANGSPPLGLKSSSHFAPELRLFTAIDEEYVVAMSLGKDSAATVTALPIGAILKLQFATNIKALRDTQELARLSERAVTLSCHIRDRIVVHDVNLASRDLRLNGADNKQKVNTSSPPPPPVQKAGTPFHKKAGGQTAYAQNGDDYDEIEQIYDYVRGFAPLPKTARGWKYEPTPPQSPSKGPVKDENNVYNLKPHPLLSPGHGVPVVIGEAGDAPPDPPPLDTLPSRQQACHKQPMEVTYPVNYAPAMLHHHHHHGGGHNHSMNHYGYGGSTQTLTKEAKKRQRRSLVEKISGSLNADLMRQSSHHPVSAAVPTSSTPRFLKSASSNVRSSHPRFFRKHSIKDMTAEAQHGGQPAAKTYTSPMFQLRYKSLTNLTNVGACSTQHLASAAAAQEYDTLDSSNSGGAKMSGDSTGSSANRSSNLPEKRSKRTPFISQLSRPKSLTNLVWGGFGGSTASINMRSTASGSGGGGSRQNLLTMDPSGGDAHPKYGHYMPTSSQRRRMSRENLHLTTSGGSGTISMHGKKLGSASSKRIGSLYL